MRITLWITIGKVLNAGLNLVYKHGKTLTFLWKVFKLPTFLVDYISMSLNLSPNHPVARQITDDGIRVLPIFLDGVQVGRLTTDGDTTEFRYNRWAKENNLWISGAMRDMDAAYVGTHGDLPAFFSNLLPEGSRRDAVASSLEISPDDEFDLFEVLGGEVIGNIRTVSSKQRIIKSTVLPLYDPDSERLSFREMAASAASIDSPLFDAQSVPGVQSKVSRMAKIIANLGLTSSAQARILPLVIIKLQDPVRKRLVQNESFFMGLAERAGLRTPNYALLTDIEKADALLVERFDRRVVGDELQRIYMEDACQLMGRHPRERYMGSYERVCDVVLGVVDKPEKAAEELYRRYLFSFGVGNGDLHAKNISVWRNPDSGEIELAPTYDVLCTYVHGDRTMALSVDGKKDGISFKALLQLADRLGLSNKQIKSISNEVLRVVDAAPAEIGEIEWDNNKVIDYKKMAKQRGKEIRGVIREVNKRLAIEQPIVSDVAAAPAIEPRGL